MSHRRFALTSLAFFLVAALVHTWPLITDPGGLSRNDTHDTIHHEWILAWDAHALATNPLRLFQTNTFYPEPDTLAYSDHIIVQGMIGAPFLWAGASPVFTYNIVLILGLALTGWTTSLVMLRWTENMWAALLSGSLMAFNAMTLTRFAEIQDQYLAFFPLALAALDRLLRRQAIRDAGSLVLWFVLQALTCGYLLAFASLSLVTATLVRVREWANAHFKSIALKLVGAALLSVLLLLPFLLPYLRVSRAQGFARSMAEVAMFSAKPTDYLGTGGRLHYALWSHRFFDREGLFPGLVGAGLTVCSLLAGVAFRDPRARMALAFGVVACCLSFGPQFPLYEPVTRVFPIMGGIRGASRFGQFFLAAVAILAGFGLIAAVGRMRRHATAVAVLLLLTAHLEALRAPVNYRRFDGLSPNFDALAAEPANTVVACFPFPPPLEAFHNVDCMLASTRFWKPLVNGYSSFMPESYARSAQALAAFPEGDTLAYLKSLGVTHVIVFPGKISAPRLARVDAHPDQLVLWKADESARIYRLR